MNEAVANRYGSMAATVYDLDKPVGHSFGDIEYYAGRLQGIVGPVLEPAVGNGRIFVPLVKQGFDMVGFDASPEMLALCQHACRIYGVNPPLYVARFDNFSFDTRFAAVIMPAGSFQLISCYEDAVAFLKRLHGHMKPGGRIVLDLDPVSDIAAAQPRRRAWQDGDDRYVLIEEPVGVDESSQTAAINLRYQLWRGRTMLASERDRLVLRWWHPDDLEQALLGAGFRDVVVSANYHFGEVPDRDTHTITLEATC